jgi:hypothetical protein
MWSASFFANREATRSSWRGLIVRSAIAYAITRLCVLMGAGVVAAQKIVEQRLRDDPHPMNAVSWLVAVLTSWDGQWYFSIARDGYPAHVPQNVTFEMPEARTAFFPLYPLLVRSLDAVLPGGNVLAGLVLNVILGAWAIYLIGLLARDLFGERVAYRTMLFAAVFPGSFVLSFSYAEALLLVLAAGCLLCLQRRQWWLAGVLAALGTATRPNGMALIAACAIASIIAIRERRQLGSLVAPLLAPLGFLAFQVFLAVRTGEPAVWLRVQREAWAERSILGGAALEVTSDAITRPFHPTTNLLTGLSMAATVILCIAGWKRRLPWPIMAYTITVLALMLLPSSVTARPRFLYTAFPLLISLAAWLPDDHHDAWAVLYVVSAAGLVNLTALYGFYGAIP